MTRSEETIAKIFVWWLSENAMEEQIMTDKKSWGLSGYIRVLPDSKLTHPQGSPRGGAMTKWTEETAETLRYIIANHQCDRSGCVNSVAAAALAHIEELTRELEHERKDCSRRHRNAELREQAEELTREVERLREQLDAEIEHRDEAVRDAEQADRERDEALEEIKRSHKAILALTRDVESLRVVEADQRARIGAALAKHQKDSGGHCETCDEVIEPQYPCDTVKALRGEADHADE